MSLVYEGLPACDSSLGNMMNDYKGVVLDWWWCSSSQCAWIIVCLAHFKFCSNESVLWSESRLREALSFELTHMNPKLLLTVICLNIPVLLVQYSCHAPTKGISMMFKRVHGFKHYVTMHYEIWAQRGYEDKSVHEVLRVPNILRIPLLS